MSEGSTSNKFFAMPTDRFNRIMAVAIAVVTLFIGVITYLQSDAGNRDDQANRDSKRYSIELMQRKISGDARVNFDYNTVVQAYYELDLLANSAENSGDQAAAERYRKIGERMMSLSPLLSKDYYNAETGDLKTAKYEADVYLVDAVALSERFEAASNVKDAWDYKANTYIIHLTLLAVALFLYGMSTTLSGAMTRWIFSLVGSGVALVAVVWAVTLYFAPVKDLRDCKVGDKAAIDLYAQGRGLAYQEAHEQAIASYNQALSCEPKYANALRDRGEAYLSLGEYAKAAADFEAAQAAGNTSASLAGQLAWTYHLMGRFADAVAMNQQALKTSPDELWIRYDLGLAYLALGKVDEAKEAYKVGMDTAARTVADARSAGQEPPSYLWWGLGDASESLDDMLSTLAGEEGVPPASAFTNAEAIKPVAGALSAQLKSLAVALEYSGKPPAGELKAKIGQFVFAEPVFDEQGNVVDYLQSDTFQYGIDAVAVLFDYEGMQDGQEIVFKVYIDDEEDPSWRLVDAWTFGAAGTLERQLSFAYSNVNVLSAGTYRVEFYVDSHLAQTGTFVVEAGQ